MLTEDQKEHQRQKALKKFEEAKRRMADKRKATDVRDASNKRHQTRSGGAPPITRASYIEYDLANMKDTLGGYLEEQEGDDLDEWKQRQAKTYESGPMSINPSENPQCVECQSFDIDAQFKEVFDTLVCRACKKKLPEKYSLLTKTEVKNDYLLTEPELKDRDLIPHLEKPNPHKNTYNNMMLYVRFQVEEYAIKKWGTLDALDAEYERRLEMKKQRKDKKYLDKLREMRKKTRAENWTKTAREVHVHDWSEDVAADENHTKRRCQTCGMETEELIMD